MAGKPKFSDPNSAPARYLEALMSSEWMKRGREPLNVYWPNTYASLPQPSSFTKNPDELAVIYELLKKMLNPDLDYTFETAEGKTFNTRME